MSSISSPAVQVLNNYVATADPTTTNDTSQGYAAGSAWLNTTTMSFWRCADATANAAVWIAMQVLDAPNTVTGRFYATYEGATATATNVATLDTVLYVYPYYVRERCTITSLALRVVTGTASSAVKMGVWANNPTLSKPTGTAISGLVSNTGQATTGNNSTAAITGLSKVITPGLYWWGSAFTTAAPACLSIGNNVNLPALAGRTGMTTANFGGYSVPYTYSSDITTLDLTAATMSDLTAAAGVPVIHYGT